MKIKRRYRIIFKLLLILNLFFTKNSLAAEGKNVTETREISVTATRSEAEVKEVPASVEIVTQEEIKAVAADDIEDILRYSESIYFYQSMLRSTPSIRGFEGKHVLILIDGRRFAGEQGKFDDPIRITTENVERIEIVRGPMSVLYGSEAMGGVINIITKRPEKTSFEMGAKYGGYSHGNNLGSSSFTLTLADKTKEGILGRTGLRISGVYLEEDPFFIEKKQTLIGEREIRNIDGLLTYRLNDKLSAEFASSYGETEILQYVLKGMQPNRYLSLSKNIYRRKDFSGRLNYKGDGLNAMIGAYTSEYNKDYESRFAQNVRIGRVQYRKGQLMPGVEGFDDGERTTDVLEAQLGKMFTGFMGSHLITVGTEVRDEGYFSARNTGKPLTNCRTIEKEGSRLKACKWDNQNTSTYLQDEWQITERLLLIPALRFDDNEQFGEEFSPKFGFTYKVLNNLRLKGNYGHSFRAPGPGELFRDFLGMGGRYHIVGNPNLSPETSDSYEVSLEGETKNLFGKVSYFYNDVKDLIDTVFVEQKGNITKYQYVNIDEAKISGFEIVGGYSFTRDIMLEFNYTYLNAVDGDNKRLETRPRHLGRIKLDWNYRPWGVKTSIRTEWKGDYGFVNSKGKFDNDSQILTNVKITKQLYKNMDIYVGANDIFDNAKWGDSPLESPGLFYYMGFNWKY